MSAFAAGDRFVVDSRLRGLDGVVRSFAVEGAVDRRAARGGRPRDAFLVVREIARDPRIAALLDAVDEPVYELELGADGIWRTTAGTGIARILGVDGADERVLAGRRARRRPGRCSRRIACGSPPGRRRAPSSACAPAAGAVRWLWERAQGRREGDRVIAVSAVADVTAWHPAAADEHARP